MNVILVSRIMLGWIIGCSILIGSIVDTDNSFYNIGPNENLIFIGITIDTNVKYICIIMYCFINTIIRSCNHNIIYPYITLHIQDVTNNNEVKHPYEIVTINTIYYWFDWFIYINLLLSQIDMIIIEMILEILISNIITYKYLQSKN
jgi:hypothetical protein